MRPLLVLGATEFSVEIADVAADAGYEIAGFVVNEVRAEPGATLVGLPVHWIDEVAPLAATHDAVCGLGTTTRSRFVRDAEARGLGFATVVHPGSRVSSTSTLGEGTVVGPGAIVAAYTTIGRHVLLNRGCLVGHHTTIGDFTSLQSGANVAGLCRIGEAAYVAMGALVLNTVSVGSHAVVGAGAVVTADVPDRAKVLGVPARIVEEGIEGK
ncbi:MAG: NeuD/PglB/VioB family sugar acetyltransferase [Pseudomonadota bacterium]